MAKEIGRTVHSSADDSWHWRGREVLLADGTGFSMPDTIENQLAYPQHGGTPGVGFPVMRAVALISLSTGTVMDLAFGKHAGKGTGEMALLRSMIGSLNRGNILAADKYYPGYVTLAALLEAGVDIVSISHHARQVDFSQGHRLGEKDHIVEWQKRIQRKDLSPEAFAALPDTIRVREFVIEIDGREGGKEEAIIVTTITAPSISQKEISDLYWRRWNVELGIRAIKHCLHMDVLRAKSPEMVRKEIWCHLLAWNLLRGVMVESAKRHEVLPRQLSTKGAMQAVESFTPAMMAIDGDPAIYDATLLTVSAHRVADWPGRQEPRYKKRRPTWSKYLTVPRNQLHRRLAAEARSLPVS